MSKLKSKLLVLELVGVTKAYRLEGVVVEAVKPTDLTIHEGDYVGIRGPSGSGKSTLMYLMGLLDTATNGKIYLKGKDVSDLSEAELARLRNQYIGFVFQQFNLLPKTTAWQNVALPLMYAGVTRSERRQKAIEALNQVGLGDRVEHRPSQLSGGQQQRVAIARALINDPMIIFADEPTGNLDTAAGAAVMRMFDKLHQQGKTIVLVTHETSVAAHARRQIQIVDGMVKEPRR